MQNSNQISIDNQDFILDINHETIFATQDQIANIFQVDRSVVTKHLKNIFECGELERDSNVQKMHITTKPTFLFSLDAIISVGYRVNSKRAIAFRKQATKILAEYISTGEVKREIKQQLPQNYIQALEALIVSEKEKELIQLQNTKQQEVIEEFINIDNDKTYTEIAKILHIAPHTFINKLREDRYIIANSRIPYQRYLDCNYFVIKKSIREINKVTKHFESYLITPKGYKYFAKKYKD